MLISWHNLYDMYMCISRYLHAFSKNLLILLNLLCLHHYKSIYIFQRFSCSPYCHTNGFGQSFPLPKQTTFEHTWNVFSTSRSFNIPTSSYFRISPSTIRANMRKLSNTSNNSFHEYLYILIIFAHKFISIFPFNDLIVSKTFLSCVYLRT